MLVGLTFDLRSDYLALGYSEDATAEFDSNLTITALEEAIQACGLKTTRIGHARALCEHLVAGERWDLVFNIAEGLAGRSREAQVPCLLELYGIPYVLSDPLVCALTLDKAITKKLVRAAGYNTANFFVLNRLGELGSVNLAYPLFAKPLAEGTGKGVSPQSFISTGAELAQVCGSILDTYRQPVLIEEYLPGREFTVGIVGNGADAHIIGTMEVVMCQREMQAIYSYEIKEQWQKYVTYTSPPVGALSEAVEALALGCYRTLECRDAARVDIRLDASGTPSFMEINPLPGMNPIFSDLPIIAYRAGLTYDGLVQAIIGSAMRRLGLQWS
ncbi:MAG: D-alanine--D-alanine ligase [Chloroflexi bacterium]|nr:D-alanine--D-alanine ligase [Chloroflexota bacterium]